MLKRTVLAIFSFLVMLAMFGHLTVKTFAQTQTYSGQAVNPYSDPNTNPDVPKNLHTYSQSIFIEIISTISCQLAGIDPINPDQKCLGVDVQNGKIGFTQDSGGALKLVTNMIDFMYTPPLHTGDFFSYLGNNFGGTSKAYADSTNSCARDPRGIGFCGLSPLITVWSVFRNVAYLLYVLVFLGVGLCIMLRVKIDPRTVMTIENSLPRIVVSLVLVTFSYAIAGFLIDIMYVTSYTTFQIIQQADPGVANMNMAFMQNNTPLDVSNTLVPENGLISGKLGVSGYAGEIAHDLRPAIRKMFDIHDCSEGTGGASGLQGLGNLASNCFLQTLVPYKIVFDIIGHASSILGITPSTHSSLADFIIDLTSAIAGQTVWYKINNMTLPTDNLQSANLSFLGFTIPTGSAISFAMKAAKAAGAIPMGYAAYVATELGLRTILPYLAVYLVVLLAVMWAMFRLWFELIKAYILILIDVILSPFWMLSGAFPGENHGVMAWLRDIAANLSVFPVTMGMFWLGRVFVDVFSGKDAQTVFLPPLINNFAANTQTIGSILSVGIILLTPQVVQIMKQVFKSPEFKFSAGIGQAIGVGASSPITAFKSSAGLYSTYAHDPYDTSKDAAKHRRTARIMQRLFGG